MIIEGKKMLLKACGGVLMCVSLLLPSCVIMDDDDSVASSDNIVNVGEHLPTFTVIIQDGSILSTSNLKGKPSVILFFSTTCPDCQQELPEMNRRYLAHGCDTTFVAISRSQPFAEISTYWQDNDLQLPYSAQEDRKVYSLFARRGIPKIIISNAEGVIERIEDSAL